MALGMPAKIFISYRRDDDPSAAARVHDGLAQTFGHANLFIDVDNLLAGQRFDDELAKALAAWRMRRIGVLAGGALESAADTQECNFANRSFLF